MHERFPVESEHADYTNVMYKESNVKIRTLAIALCILPAIVFASDVEEGAKHSLDLWEPRGVQFQGEILTVISKERQVTDTIYHAMIGGLCMGLIVRPKSLNGVSEIRILNQFGRQGYVFEGGASECAEIVDMPISQTKIHVLGMTHLYTN